jgi:hypothetical protein
MASGFAGANLKIPGRQLIYCTEARLKSPHKSLRRTGIARRKFGQSFQQDSRVCIPAFPLASRHMKTAKVGGSQLSLHSTSLPSGRQMKLL